MCWGRRGQQTHASSIRPSESQAAGSACAAQMPWLRAVPCCLPPPWQAALGLAVPPGLLLHLGPLNVLHIGLDHLSEGKAVSASLALPSHAAEPGQGRRPPSCWRPVVSGARGREPGCRSRGDPPPCAAGAGHCTPSSSPTPAPPAGKLQHTQHQVCPLHRPHVDRLRGRCRWGLGGDTPSRGHHGADSMSCGT